VPTIHRQLLASVVFLYPSEEAAREGRAEGGTGFLTTVPTGELWTIGGGKLPQDMEVSEERHLYIVTAAHVVRHGAANVARFTFKDETEVVPLPEKAWTCAPDATDVAVARLGIADEGWRNRAVPYGMYIHQVAALHVSFGNPEGWIGAGDDCFFLGRFSTHEGCEHNRPSARFGTLAMTHGETIVDEYGCHQESFLVEARSLAGYSGSPVFVYKSAGMDPDTGEVKPHVSASVFLLGVDWCHLSNGSRCWRMTRRHECNPRNGSGKIPGWLG
jgi:hypothetical protein